VIAKHTATLEESHRVIAKPAATKSSAHQQNHQLWSYFKNIITGW
jgi:hypothetical protein